MIDGIIVVNKPKGCTSHDVVRKIKKIFNNKVGHTGTLDPNATGVLPLLIGNATKLSYYLINHDKEYEVTLQFGIKTDTADSEGNIIEQQNFNEDFVKNILNKEKVKNVLNSFIGKQEQIPPMYSAIKINGKKLYEYARNGQEVEIKPRQIEIYSIELLKIKQQEKQIMFKVNCSKGTYIRSLCEDLAKKLDTIGYMKELNRTKVGDFYIEKSVTLEELEANKESISYLEQNTITIEKFFKIYKQEGIENNIIILNQNTINKFMNGVKIKKNLKKGLYRIYNEKNEFIGIGLVENNLLKREIVVENSK